MSETVSPGRFGKGALRYGQQTQAVARVRPAVPLRVAAGLWQDHMWRPGRYPPKTGGGVVIDSSARFGSAVASAERHRVSFGHVLANATRMVFLYGAGSSAVLSSRSRDIARSQ